jgi:hypothetical protein
VPRYLLEMTPTTDPERLRARQVAARRFPEVAIEHGLATRDCGRPRELWVCRAPSPGHLRRWADACGIALGSVERVDVVALRRGRSP